jgi:hypothetical protein
LFTPDDVFRLHPKIRWTALSLEVGTVEFSQMRAGVVSHTSDAEDRAFMESGPLFMTGIAERLTPERKAGELQCLIACFEKDYVLMTRAGEGYLALSVEREEALTVFEEIIPQVLRLASKS